jgi:hypothetical protein
MLELSCGDSAVQSVNNAIVSAEPLGFLSVIGTAKLTLADFVIMDKNGPSVHTVTYKTMEGNLFVLEFPN